jgi:broad specificity phosphatase PhoE
MLDVNRNKVCFIGCAILALFIVIHFSHCSRQRSKTALHMIVVRHAEAFTNLDGTEDMPQQERDSLTPKGIEQAEATGRALKKRLVARWISSPAGRAKQTCEILAMQNKVPGEVVTDSAFVSTWDGVLPDGSPVPWAWREAQWKAGKDPRPMGGESLSDVVERVRGKIEYLKQEYTGQTVVIVTHSDVCAAMVGHALGTPMSQRVSLHKVGLAGVVEIHVRGDGLWEVR